MVTDEPRAGVIVSSGQTGYLFISGFRLIKQSQTSLGVSSPRANSLYLTRMIYVKNARPVYRDMRGEGASVTLDALKLE